MITFASQWDLKYRIDSLQSYKYNGQKAQGLINKTKLLTKLIE